MEEALARYLAPRVGADLVHITALTRVPGGASRETWMFKATWECGGAKHREAFVLRKDPPASLLETDRAAEYAFYSAFYGSGVPVPRMRWLEPDPAPLGSPFFIMERITGCESDPRTLLSAAYEAGRPAIARTMYEILAAIASFDWRDSPIEAVAIAPARGECWRRELERWEKVVDENELSPQPVSRAAIRWLRAHPPPVAQRISVVHGDFRAGNFLYTADSIAALVDWEMAHLGDPLEDLAWSFMEAWEWGRDGRKGGIISEDEAVCVYTARSGIEVDRDALAWWKLLGDVKFQAILLTGARVYQEGRNRELIMPVTSYAFINAQDQAMLRGLGRAG